MADAASKGRVGQGENNVNAKLRDEYIPTIRKLHAHGTLQDDIADMYGVTQQAIQQVCSRKTWKHIK